MIFILLTLWMFEIFSALREFRDVELRIETFQKVNQPLLNRSLLEKQTSVLPPKIINLFALTQPLPESLPVQETKPNVSEVPKVSLSDLVNHFRDSMFEKLGAVNIPELPKPDFSKIKLRGFFRKNKANKAIVFVNDKIVLVSQNQKIAGDFLLEECDFFREKIRVKYLPIGSVHEISLERPPQ